ncbi:MAG TPA: hypothetical protein VGK00_11545 [Anaerolineales bacterium]
MRTFLMLILFLLMSTGCQPVSSNVVTIQPSNEATSEVISPKATSAEKVYPEHFKTVEPSQTHPPIASTSTATPVVTFLELPAWIKNPSNQIVLFGYHGASWNGASKIGFFNAASGEQAIVRLPKMISQYYWKDANHIMFLNGYCGEPLVQATELDTSQGTLSPATAGNLPGDIAYCYGLEAAPATIKLNTTYSEPTVEILDPSSGAWLRVTDPTDGFSDIDFALSPNNDYLGVVQIRGKYTFPELWQPLYGNQVSVFHLPDRKLIASYTEEKKISAMLLFTDNENIIYVRGDTPCVISIAAATKKCIHAVADRFPGSTIILGDPWKDGKQFSFLYFGFFPHHGGWCIADLFSGEINCPTDEYADLQGQTIVNYAISPDSKYLLIEYDRKGCPIPWCDYFGSVQVAVIDIAGKKFLKLGDAETYQAMGLFRDAQPWRPAP